MTMRQKMPKQQ